MGELLGTSKANVTRTKAHENDSNNQSILEMSVDDISPNKEQPRKKFDEDSLIELCDSIKMHGMIEPLVITKCESKNKKEYYQIIAGERRWRAAKMAGLDKVPVVIKDYDEKQMLEIALIENIQREDLNAIEEAQAYSELIKKCNLTQDQLAERVSKSRTAITNSMRLLKLSKKVQQMVIDEKLSAGHVRALLSIEDKNVQYEFAQMIFDKKLSVRETEKKVKQYLQDKESTNHAEEKQEDSTRKAVQEAYHQKENDMQDYLKAKVSIQDKGNKGKIVISYQNLEEFERIYDLITQTK